MAKSSAFPQAKYFSEQLMLLAIEQGNTNTLFAVHDGDSWIAQWRSATESTRTADEYAVWLSQLLAMSGLSLEHLDGCIISSVVPQSLFNLRNLSRRYLKVEPLVIGENADLGVAIRIEKPSEAGADRLVNAVGAHIVYPGPLIVIDSGTATTFDIVGADGGFEGGVIAPGINLSMQALHNAAAKLPRIAIQRPDRNRVVGTDTVSAMQSGVFWGYIALIEGLVSRIKDERGQHLTVVATGGVASLFEGATECIDHFDQDLTIRGLLEISRRNPSRPVA
jgi:type III pantothenate kinase